MIAIEETTTTVKHVSIWDVIDLLKEGDPAAIEAMGEPDAATVAALEDIAGQWLAVRIDANKRLEPMAAAAQIIKAQRDAKGRALMERIRQLTPHANWS
jgi:hypothetical protein